MLHSAFASQTPSKSILRTHQCSHSLHFSQRNKLHLIGCRNLVKWPQTWTSEQEPFPVAPTVLDFRCARSPVVLCTQPVLSIQEVPAALPVPALPGRAGLESSWIRSHLHVLNTPFALLLCIPLSLPLEITPFSLAYHRLFTSPYHPCFPGVSLPAGPTVPLWWLLPLLLELGSTWSLGPEARAISPEWWGGR